jgi:hypothetical protein
MADNLRDFSFGNHEDFTKIATFVATWSHLCQNTVQTQKQKLAKYGVVLVVVVVAVARSRDTTPYANRTPRQPPQHHHQHNSRHNNSSRNSNNNSHNNKKNSSIKQEPQQQPQTTTALMTYLDPNVEQKNSAFDIYLGFLS